MTSAIHDHTVIFKSSPGSAYGSSLIGSYLTEGAGHGRVHVHADERVFSIRRQIGVVCRWDIRDDHIHTLLLPFSVWVILLSLLKIRGMQGDRTIGQERLEHFLSDPSNQFLVPLWGHLPFLHTSPSSSCALSPYCSPPAAVSPPAESALPRNTTIPSNQRRANGQVINLLLHYLDYTYYLMIINKVVTHTFSQAPHHPAASWPPLWASECQV